MPDLKEQARTLGEQLSAKQAEAAAAWTKFDALRQSAVSEGVDFTKNTDAFTKLDEAGKAYDAAKAAAADIATQHARLLELAGASGGGKSDPFRTGADDPASRDRMIKDLTKGWGERYTESDEYRQVKELLELSGGARIGTTRPVKIAERAEVKATLTTLTTDGAAGSAGAALFEDRRPGIIGLPQANLDILDLITFGATDERVVSWIVETVFQNNAAEVAENAQKPETSFGFDEVDTTVRDIAHWTKLTRQTARDIAGIQTWINNRMIYGVRRRLQKQIVSGDGTGVNLLGLYNQAGILSQTWDDELTGDARALALVEAIHMGMTTLRTTAFGYEPNAVLINPTDWQTIRLAKNGNGDYYYGGPGNAGTVTIWGLPPVVHPDAPVGNPMVGDFSEAVFWLREGMSVNMTDSDGNDFQFNRLTVRAEMAGAFGVLQPAAFVEITPDAV
jgi:HK97 family phage major capsid protein